MSKPTPDSLMQRVRGAPYLAWVLAGFAISYLLFFLIPVFFRLTADYGPFIPVWGPLHAVDLRMVIAESKEWLVVGHSPYLGRNLYPPATYALFAPLILMDFSVAYTMVTLLTGLAYVWTVLVLPAREGHTGIDSAVLMLVFLTGLFSYGLRFELERGQFNLVAGAAAFLAIFLFHHHHRLRWLAYLLFILAVQLKLYPFIFIIMLVSDWRDWRGNLKRMGLLTLANCAMLFALGPRIMLDFFSSGSAFASSDDPIWRWIGNHSIRSFVEWFQPYVLTQVRPAWGQHLGWIQISLLAGVGVCLALIWLRAQKRPVTGIDPYLLLACTLGALLVPAMSIDYKLSLLPGPVALLLMTEDRRASRTGISVARALAAITFCLAYSSTLFSYANRPPWLGNSAPVLLAMLVIVTLLCLASPRAEPQSSLET